MEPELCPLPGPSRWAKNQKNKCMKLGKNWEKHDKHQEAMGEIWKQKTKKLIHLAIADRFGWVNFFVCPTCHTGSL